MRTALMQTLKCMCLTVTVCISYNINEECKNVEDTYHVMGLYED